MSVLKGIPHDKHIDSIRDATDALVSKSRCLKQNPTWSICELKLSEADFLWLKDWVSSLRKDQLALTLRQTSRLPKVGLLLLAFAAETCRRDGRERGIYEVFADGPFQDDARSVLLTTLQYPRKQVQNALEQACRIFGLRHAFDSPTTQPWYLTTKLQFGFTLQGAKDHLKHWLIGVAPDAIEWLLKGESQSNHAGTPIRSDSFGRLWDALGRYRTGKISTLDVRQAIAESPWVLTNWADSLLEAAQCPVTGTEYVYIPIADREQSDHSDSDSSATNVEPQICTSPRVQWANNEASLVVRFDETFLGMLNDDCFFVSVDDATCDVLRRQPDGSYSNNAGDMLIGLPPNREEVIISICDDKGKGVAVQTLPLFASDEDFQAYGKNGTNVSLRQLSQQSGYTLRLPAGTKVGPDQNFELRVTKGDTLWVQLKPGWSNESKVRLPDDTFDILLKNTHETNEEDWTDAVCEQASTHEKDGARFQLSFSAPSDVSILDVKVCGETVAFYEVSNGSYRTAIMSMSSLRHDGKGTMRIVAERDKCRVIHRDFQARREGIIVFQRGAWKQHLASQPLDGTRLSRAPIVIRPGETHRPEGWTLLEGSSKTTFRADKPYRLSTLGCRGWPLYVTDHLYNRPAGSEPQQLCSGVVDHGIIQDGVQRPGSRLVVLELLDELDCSADHHVVLWTRSGRLVNVASELIHVTENLWTIDPDVTGIEYEDLVVVAAIAFRGTRLGTWWTEDWWRPVTHVRDSASATEVAACLRWFHLPLMQHPRELRSCASVFGEAFFREWCLSSTGGPTSHAEHRKTDQFLASDLLCQDEDEINWYPTVRCLLGTWQPTPEEARSIAPEWGSPEESRISVEQIVGTLATSMPVITARFLCAWFSTEINKATERAGRHILSCNLCKDLEERAALEHSRIRERGFDPAERHPSLPWLELNKRFIDTLVETANAMVAGGTVVELDAKNLESAFNFSDLCRVIAARLIEPAATPCASSA